LADEAALRAETPGPPVYLGEVRETLARYFREAVENRQLTLELQRRAAAARQATGARRGDRADHG
jgi:hypothetical protein